MLDAVRAEGLKLHRHRATWLMVWIYPVLCALLIFAVVARDALYGPDPASIPVDAAQWIQQSALVWGAPLSSFGRFLIAAFAAVVFAGEYGWNTWKLIIPARSRWQLIGAKWIVAFAFIFAAFASADAIIVSGSIASAALGGATVPDAVTPGAVLEAHAVAAGHAIVPVVYTFAVAGLIAVLTTSVLGTVIGSIATIVLEQLLQPIGGLAYSYAPGAVETMLVGLPFYHVANLIALAAGTGLSIQLARDAVISSDSQTSLLVVLAWIFVAGAATIARFARQDLN